MNKEDLINKAAEEYAKAAFFVSPQWVATGKELFKAGIEWRDNNLWHSADGDDLPEIDRGVIVFTQTERQYPKVAIAHTMPMGDWKQFDGNRYYLERNGEVGWSLPDVKIWLDAPLPFKEGGEE